MRVSLALAAAAAQAGYVLGFPAVADFVGENAGTADVEERQSFPDPNVGFHPKEQHVSIEGEHKWMAPDFENGDVRGPCPGLNALANHGYIPRNGVGNHVDFIEGTFKGFGMAEDLSGFLTVFGAILDGDGLRWSIGGPSKYVPAPLGGLLGTPQGISASHNKYEADVSPCRGDLYKFGNDYELQMEQFELLWEMGQKNGDNYDLDVLNEFRSKRFDNSVATNPYFWNGPFTGTLVAPAAFEFIYRFMGNKSEEHPQGHLNGQILMDFMSIKRDGHGKFKWTPGHERIPYNWYRRADLDAYSIPLLNLDTVLAAKRYPKFFTIGGNLGKVNTLKGLDPGNLTGTAMTSKDLLKGNNLACFALSAAAQGAPDMIKCSKVLGKIDKAMGMLNSQLAKSIAGLDCGPLGKLDQSQFSQFPGYSKLKCETGTY